MRFSAEVFAVEDTSMQVTWRGAPAGPVTITVSDDHSTRRLESIGESGPGAMIVDELDADTEYRITIAPKGAERGQPRQARTLPTLPGVELTRLSTISDIHIGESGFGEFPRIVEDPGRRSRTRFVAPRRRSTSGRDGARNTSCSKAISWTTAREPNGTPSSRCWQPCPKCGHSCSAITRR